MTTDNNNEDTVPDLVECHLTGMDFEMDECTQLPRTNMGNWNAGRRARWILANPDVDVNTCPFPEPEMVWVANEVTYAYCSECGQIFDKEDDDAIYEIEVCSGCSHNYEHCYEHDLWHGVFEGCEHCEMEDEADENYSSLVRDYSYRPTPVFHIVNKGRMETIYNMEPAKIAVTGFELEMENSGCSVDEGAHLANELFGSTTYLKHDGSLDGGFEMVSHPMSLDYLNNHFNFCDMKRLADIGMRSARTTTCGLHVHINKGFFNGIATSAYRFMSVFYANSEQWCRLAGRSRSSYAKWDINEYDRLLSYTRNLKSEPGGWRFNGDRYVAVNLQPSHTIELRFFKGTLRPDTLHARLQAVHAVAEFAVASRNNINIKKSASWDEFRSWTEQHSDRFGVFNTYANEKGV